jgi:Carboxypeptidase regulatory-like domain
MFRRTPTLLLALALALPALLAQTSTGIISGTVTDESGAVIANATVTITNKASGAPRSVTANSAGIFSAPALEAGQYEVRAETAGFRTTVRDATVTAGNTTTVDMTMRVGESKEVVNVEAAAAQISYESHTVAGNIGRSTIQELPLNGRGFLQLATLEPGVVMVPGSPSQYNGATFTISIGGGISGRTLIALDGTTTWDAIQGGTQMNFSQEIVAEFQLQSVNYDLATGITSSGSVNVVTRSGSNDFHGSGYFFFRDHNMAAYPGLARQISNPNPFFARRNPGFLVSGPIVKDKLFFFFNYEYQNQVQAITVQHDLPVFAPLDNVYSSPFVLATNSTRLDYHINDKHSLFFRFSHDGNHTFGLPGSNAVQPSTWVNNINWAQQSVLGVTSSLTPTIVNDFRLQYQYWRNNNLTATPQQCLSPCIGQGLPAILTVIGTTFNAGNYYNAPQSRHTRRYEITDNLNWQRGTHRFRFGTDLERFNGPTNWDFCDPFCTALLAPSTPVRTNADFLNMLVYNLPAGIFTGIGIGNPNFPGPYNHDEENSNFRPRIYFSDTWKIKPNLTLDYGVAWEYETGLFNSDLTPPAFLQPLYSVTYGPNSMNPTRPIKNEWQPVLGFAWSPAKSGKTVIRGGAGLYWETNYIFEKWRGESVFGPLGNSRITLDSTALTNIYSGLSIPVGAALPVGVVTGMTLGQMLNIYNQQIGALTQKFGESRQKNGAIGVTGLDVAKQAIELFPPNYTLGRSYQTSLGVQRDLGHNMVLTADWARRQGAHFNLTSDLDINHTNWFVNGVAQPIIPACTAAQRYVPGQECVQGPINEWTPEGRSVYEALLIKLQKRFSHGFQGQLSYALQNLDTDYTVVAANNYLMSYGPSLPRHNLNLAGTGRLPWGFDLSLNMQMLSRSPVTATTNGVDLSGTGVSSSTPLPGLQYGCLNLTCSKADLSKAVAAFDSTYAGTKAPNGAVIPTYVLPTHYQLGDPTINQDFRLTKNVTIKERYKFSVFGEVFNAFNIANLRGYGSTLDTYNSKACGPLAAGASTTSCAAQNYAFGQPTQRALQTFGSAGPRAFQVGGRFTF